MKIMHKLTGSKRELLGGEYPDTGDFPHQLYVRLSRRMVGPYVMTQHDLEHKTKIDDSIGLGGGWALKVDIYPCRLVATPDGKVASEGEVFDGISPGPYPISYRSITPKPEQCSNLLVPVCISASHVALSSIRMQDTYAIMGESAGIAAAQAIDEKCQVQAINRAAYRQSLLNAGQILEWDPSWDNYDSTAGSPGGVHVEAFASVEEWNRKKPGYEWLFPFIDKNGDGKISREEHQAFQDYKKRNENWASTLRSALLPK